MKKIIEKIYTNPAQELMIKTLGVVLTTLSTAYLVVYIVIAH